MHLPCLFNRLKELPFQAVVYFEKSGVSRKSYPEVAEDVLAECEWLTAHGIRCGTRIGILSENSYAWVIHELSCLRLGCVLVTFPPDEFAGWVFDELATKYDLELLLASKRELNRRDCAPRYVVDAERPWGDFEPRHSARTSLDSDVYSLVFSSGTSGRLKCILISAERKNLSRVTG